MNSWSEIQAVCKQICLLHLSGKKHCTVPDEMSMHCFMSFVKCYEQSILYDWSDKCFVCNWGEERVYYDNDVCRHFADNWKVMTWFCVVQVHSEVSLMGHCPNCVHMVAYYFWCILMTYYITELSNEVSSVQRSLKFWSQVRRTDSQRRDLDLCTCCTRLL